MVGFSVIGFVLIRLSRRTGDPAVVSELGDELSGVGFGIAAALVAVLLPVQLLLAVVQTLASLDTSGPATRFGVNPANLVGDLTDPIRILIGVVLDRAGRSGRPPRAYRPGAGAGLHRDHADRPGPQSGARRLHRSPDRPRRVELGGHGGGAGGHRGDRRPPPVDRPAGHRVRRHPDLVGAVLRPRLHLRPDRCAARLLRGGPGAVRSDLGPADRLAAGGTATAGASPDRPG